MRNNLKSNRGRRCLLFVLSFALSLTALSPFFSTDVNAISDWDSAYRTTDQLLLGNDDGDLWDECSNIDYTTSWTSLFDLANVSNYYKDSWAIAQESGRWFVSQYNYEQNGSNSREINVYWTENDSLELNFDQQELGVKLVTASGTSGNSITFRSKAFQSGGNDCDPTFVAGNAVVSSASEYGEGSTYFENVNFFANLDEDKINYPEDYEGEDVRDNFTIQTKLRPDVVYLVDKFDISALINSEQELPGGLVPSSYKIHYTLYDHDSTEVLKDQSDMNSSVFKFTVDDYGTYGLDVSFEPRGIPYPGLPDGYQFITTKLKIKVDGSVYASNSNNDECDSDGECEVSNNLEDCDVYGTDIIGGFGCHIRNFLSQLKAGLLQLFVPTGANIKKTMDNFMNSIEDKFGFVFTAFNMMVTWITSMLSATPQCYLNTGGTFYGSPVSIDMCSFENAMPTAWNYGIILVRLSFAVALLFACFARMKQIVTSLGTA